MSWRPSHPIIPPRYGPDRRLVASSLSPFSHTAHRFALDDIEVARPILENSEGLSEDTLLKVVGQKSQDHMMAVTRRRRISEAVSHALVERGDDAVVTSLLTNARPRSAPTPTTWSPNAPKPAPPCRRRWCIAPAYRIELLNDLYLKVESDLRREIVSKFESVPPEELEAAFAAHPRSRFQALQQPEDFDASKRRDRRHGAQQDIDAARAGQSMREGPASRTAFKTRLSPALPMSNIDLIERVVERPDLDTVALLCRGSQFRPRFVRGAGGRPGSKRACSGRRRRIRHAVRKRADASGAARIPFLEGARRRLMRDRLAKQGTQTRTPPFPAGLNS